MKSLHESPAAGRFLFVDQLRGWAVFVMIETHVVNAVLASPLREGAAFKVPTFVNGLVAPSFLFCAGFGLAISLRRRWAQYIGWAPPFWRTIVRMVFIMVVGYSLHLPFFSLRRMAAITDEHSWTTLFQVDILQVIAATLLLLTLLAPVARTLKLYRIVISLIALAVVFIAPLTGVMDLSGLPIWLRPYLSPQFESQFPLLPWASFLICGSILGFWYMEASERKKEEECMKRFGMLAFGGILLAIAVEFLPFAIYTNHDFWRSSPEFFLVRLGCVVLALVALWSFSRKRQASSSSFIALFGQESLLVYVAHLLIVYGRDYGFSFVRKFGPTLGYLECLGLFAGLTIGMYLIAFAWHRLKGWNMRVAYAVEASVLGGTVVAFVMQ